MYCSDDLNEYFFNLDEAAGNLRVFEIVTEQKDLKDLAGDIAVLTPPGDLVVGEFRNLIRECRDFRVQIELRLPAISRNSTRAIATVDNRKRSA